MNQFYIYIAAAGAVIAVIIAVIIIKIKNGTKGYDFSECTPAEAGFILKNRGEPDDIMALIYFWAVNGIIAIEEVDSPKGEMDKIFDAYSHNHDYHLVKVKTLDENAREYEKLLFNKIFDENSSFAEISSLKKGFYNNYREVLSELTRFIDTNNYYRGNSRKIGEKFAANGKKMVRIFKLESKGALIATTVLMFSLVFIPYLLIAGIFLLLGKIVPRKTQNGKRCYKSSLYFKKKILNMKEAEIKERNGEFYNDVLPYAAALGKVREWNQRAGDRVSNVPEWYRGYGEYGVSDFINFVDKSYYVFRRFLLSMASESENLSIVKRYRK